MKKYNKFFHSIFVIIVLGLLRGVYSIFFVDTSIQLSNGNNLILPAEEILVDSDGEIVSSREKNNIQVLPGDTSKPGVVSISDRRDFATSERETSVVVNNLDAPWALTFLPNGNMLITERFGQLKLFTNGEISDIVGVPEVFSSGQGGLLDVIAHPNYIDNNYIYLSYVSGTQEGNYLSVARGKLNGVLLENVEVIFEVEQKKRGTSHFGSRFAWLPDTTLVFSVGDGGNPPITYNGVLIREQAQNISSHLGKIMRIHDDGTIPQDNPFVGRPDVKPEIYSYGHRNIQGITYDTIHDSLIASEHGSKGGDELNQIVSGKNYGRPVVSYATEYDRAGTLISDQQSHPEFIDPLVVWTPTIAPSAVVSYTGDQYDGRKGDIFLAAMLIRSNNSIGAYATSPAGALLRMERDALGNIIDQERLYVGDVRVRSIKQGPDGYIYIVTDDTSPQKGSGKNAGKILKLLR